MIEYLILILVIACLGALVTLMRSKAFQKHPVPVTVFALVMVVSVTCGVWTLQQLGVNQPGPSATRKASTSSITEASGKVNAKPFVPIADKARDASTLNSEENHAAKLRFNALPDAKK